MTQATTGQLDRIEQMIRLTERLTELLALQAAAFESRRPQDAAASMEETTRLANTYRHEAQRLRSARGEIERASPGQKKRLRQTTEAFDAVVARHGRALHAAKTVTEGLVHAIANEVARQRGANSGYGPRGVRNTGATSASITLNQRA